MEIDKDASGTLRRGELNAFLRGLSKSIPDQVISALIDFCDSDGDARTLSMAEFCAVRVPNPSPLALDQPMMSRRAPFLGHR